MTDESPETTFLDMNDVQLEITHHGNGSPLLFLHPGFPSGRVAPTDPIISRLAASHRVICPTHPGFGVDSAPDWMTTVDDLAYFYMDVLSTLGLHQVVLVGASFGGWIAAEIAVKSTARISSLVLVNPVGIKSGGRETRDIVDIYSLVDSNLAELAYADPSIGHVVYTELSDEELIYIARSREATARYGWSPFLHDPKLQRRLRRIDIPVLVVEGDADRVTRPGYGQAYASAIPGARFMSLTGAGHFPHLEAPDKLGDLITQFVDDQNPKAPT